MLLCADLLMGDIEISLVLLMGQFDSSLFCCFYIRVLYNSYALERATVY